MSIVTSTLANGWTLNASPYVIGPALMSARMPPEFMNATTAGAPLAAGQVGPDVAHSWASAMMSPSDDSPAAFCGAGQRRGRRAEDPVLDRRGDLAVLVDEGGQVGGGRLHRRAGR